MEQGEDAPLPDFLDLDEAAVVREEQFNRDLEFAQQHMVFVDDPRAARLLQGWKDAFLMQRIPVGSSIDAYAAAEAVRAFLATIERQIKFAQTGKFPSA